MPRVLQPLYKDVFLMKYVKGRKVFCKKAVEDYNAFANIVVCTDKNFSKAMGVLLVSLAKNMTIPMAVHIFYNGELAPDEEGRLRRFVAAYDCPVNVYQMDNSCVQALHTTEDINGTAYYRFLCPHILSELEGIEKILYLDVDMLCVKDISDIFSFDLGKNIAYVVNDDEYRGGVFKKVPHLGYEGKRLL